MAFLLCLSWLVWGRARVAWAEADAAQDAGVEQAGTDDEQAAGEEAPDGEAAPGEEAPTDERPLEEDGREVAEGGQEPEVPELMAAADESDDPLVSQYPTVISQDGKWAYRDNGFDEAIIVQYLGSEETVSVPPDYEHGTLDGFPVVEISEHAFSDCTTVREVYIYDPVTELSAGAFEGCSSLETVHFNSDGIKEIPSSCFEGCVNLKSVTIPGNVKLIDKRAFYGCTALEDLSFIPGLELKRLRIKEEAFAHCESLQEVALPANLYTIDAYAFDSCTSLETIVFEGSPTWMPYRTFSNCDAVKVVFFLDSDPQSLYHIRSLILPEGTSFIKFALDANGFATIGEGWWSGQDSVGAELKIPSKVGSYEVHGIMPDGFKDHTNLKSVVFPEECYVDTIGARAFSGCKSLSSVTIPSTVTTLGEECFKDCGKLDSLEFETTRLKELPASAFESCNNIKTLTVPEGVEKLGIRCFGKCLALKEVRLPSSLSDVEKEVFAGCLDLRDIYMPDCDKDSTFFENAFLGLHESDLTFHVRWGSGAWWWLRGNKGHEHMVDSTVVYDPVPLDDESVDVTINNSFPATYCMAPTKPVFTVTRNGHELQYAEDYTIDPTSGPRTDRGPAQIDIIGEGGIFTKGTFTGRRTIPFTIHPAPLSVLTTMDPVGPFPWDGKMRQPEVTFHHEFPSGRTYDFLSEEYTVTYQNCTDGNTAIVKLTMKDDDTYRGNFTGSKDFSFTIEPRNLENDATVTLSQTVYPYTGVYVEPVPTVTVLDRDDKPVTLTADDGHFDISYQNNLRYGAASLTITGKAPYTTGTVTIPFQIRYITGHDITVDDIADQTYTGEAIKPQVTVRALGSVIPDSAYEVVALAGENVNVGKGKAVIRSTKSEWVTSKEFNIVPRSVSVTAADDSKAYGAPDPELTAWVIGAVPAQQVAYTLERESGEALGDYVITPKGETDQGNYTVRFRSGTFTIEAAQLEDMARLAEIPDQTYTGTALEPNVTVVRDDGGTPLIEDVDYKVAYEHNVEVGTATVTVTGLGNALGTLHTTFKVVPRDIADAKVSFAQDSIEWWGGEERRLIPTVTLDGLTLEEHRDYTVTFADDRDPGTAKVTVSGTGNYTGTALGTYEVTPYRVVVTPDDLTKTYVDPDPALTYTLDRPLWGSDTLDVTLSREPGPDAGTYAITASGEPRQGGYEVDFGADGTLTIERSDLHELWPSVTAPDVMYDGTDHEPIPTVQYGDMVLVYGRDYDVLGYADNRTVGKAIVYVEGIGNFKGIKAGYFQILKRPAEVRVNDCTKLIGEDDPQFTVSETNVVEGDHIPYEFSRELGEECGAYAIDVQANYQWLYTYDLTYVPGKLTITGGDLSDATVTCEEQTYSGTALEPEPTVTLRGVELARGTDYEVTGYEDNVDAGMATVTVEGKGNFEGTALGTFMIAPHDLSGSGCSVGVPVQEYTGQQLTPDPSLVCVEAGKTTLTLRQDVDYEVTGYGENVRESGTVQIRGIGNFAGTNEGAFRIVSGGNLDLASMGEIPDQTYTGSPIEPGFTVSVSDADLLLRPGIDYTVTFEDNVDAGTAKVTIAGIAPIKGSLAGTFQILPASIADATVTAKDQTYDGTAQRPELRVTVGDLLLVAGKDYTVTNVVDNVNVGTATVTITGQGNYEGVTTGTFNIVRRAVTVRADDASKTFGDADPKLTATVTGLVGSETVSYELVRAKGEDAGTYDITASGEADQGNYAVTYVGGTFTVRPRDLSAATVTCDDQIYAGSALTPTPTVTLGGAELVQGTDYTASYANNCDVGNATVTVTGTGNYAGTAEGGFAIKPFDLSGSGSEVNAAIQLYTGLALEPTANVTAMGVGGRDEALVQDRDFVVTGYEDNVAGPVGTVSIEGTGNYTGTNKGTFSIVSDHDLTLGIIEPIEDQPYTGVPVEPRVRVSLRDVDLLIREGVDYVVSYEDNVNVGTATVVVTGIGAITGELSTTFRIVATDLSSAVVTAEDQTYAGSALEPAPVVTLAGTVLPESDYTVSYEDNVEAGTARVSVVAAGANVTGTATGTFSVVPRDITGPDCTVTVALQEYTGSQITPDPSVVRMSVDGKTLTLVKGVDYEVTGYGENVKDKGTVTIAGIDNFTGTNEGTFAIVSSTDLTQGHIRAIPTQTYTGSAIEPALHVELEGVDMVLVRDVDYTATFEHNVDAGTATVTVEGIAPLTGTLTTTFKIVPTDLSGAEVTAETQVYTGFELTPTPMVTLGGAQLVAGVDFEVSGYDNNVHAGTAGVSITGKGNYVGSAAGTFEIGRRSLPGTAAVSQPGDVTFSGMRQQPAVTVTDGDGVLRPGVDYGLVYGKNVGVGDASVSVVGRGDYEGTVTVTFEILPKPVTVTAHDLAKTYGEKDPALTVSIEGVVDELAVAYELSREPGEDAGQYAIHVSGAPEQGNYAVTFVDGSFTVRQASLAAAEIAAEDQVYAGVPLEPEVRVSLGDAVLVPGVDYDVRYLNNLRSGRATVVVTGKGNYRATGSGRFQIAKALLMATYAGEAIAWDGSPKLAVDVSGFVGGETDKTAARFRMPVVEAPDVLVPGEHYELLPSGGSARDYEFSYVSGVLSVGLRPVSDDPVAQEGLTYIGSEQVGVAERQGFSVQEGVATDAGTYTAVATLDEGWSWLDGSTGQRTLKWSIAPVAITATAHADIPDQVHTGSACEPPVQLTYGDAVLVEGKDYELSYADNVELGTARAVITGLGNFEGALEIPFAIVEASYELVSGPSEAVEQGVSAAFTFERVGDGHATFAHFIGVKMDGRTLTDAAYDARSGSVAITLKPGFTKTLSVGDHVLTAVFDDGSAEAPFSVRAPHEDPVNPDDPDKPVPVIPQTGEGTPTEAMPIILFSGFIALLAGLSMRKPSATD